MAVGSIEVLMLLILTGGGQVNDLVSFLPPETYFQSRRVPVNFDNMIYLAAKDPVDGKTQVGQLLALRLLAERAEEAKKSKIANDILKTVEKIARGELANDRTGFAREYAARALVRLKGNGKIPPAQAGNLRADTLGWFPAGATIVGGLDFRGSQGDDSSSQAFSAFAKKFIPEREWEQVFSVVDQLGNIRLDRCAFAYTADPARQGKDQFYMRISGKADHQRLVEAIKNLAANERLVVQATKDDKGVPITILQNAANHPPVMALIGDTDFVAAGFSQRRENHRDVFDNLLAVRAGKKISVLKGSLKDAINKTADKAVGILVGDVPDDVRNELARELGSLPTTIQAELLRSREGITFRVQGSLTNEEAARNFTQAVVRLRQKGLQELKNIPPQAPLPPGTIDALRKTIESLQITTKGNSVEGSILVPPEGLLTLPGMFFLRSRVDLPPMPRFEK